MLTEIKTSGHWVFCRWKRLPDGRVVYPRRSKVFAFWVED